MSKRLLKDLDRLLTDREAAEYLQTRGCEAAKATLQTWRSLGEGPTYIKLGRAVRYLPEDLDSWILERMTKVTVKPWQTRG